MVCGGVDGKSAIQTLEDRPRLYRRRFFKKTKLKLLNLLKLHYLVNIMSFNILRRKGGDAFVNNRRSVKRATVVIESKVRS